MKTQKNILFNSLSTLLLIFIFLSFVACNSQEKKAEKTDSTITKTEIDDYIKPFGYVDRRKT